MGLQQGDIQRWEGILYRAKCLDSYGFLGHQSLVVVFISEIW